MQARRTHRPNSLTEEPQVIARPWRRSSGPRSPGSTTRPTPLPPSARITRREGDAEDHYYETLNPAQLNRDSKAMQNRLRKQATRPTANGQAKK